MTEKTEIYKAVASVAMSITIAIATYVTKEPNCLFGLLLIACLW